MIKVRDAPLTRLRAVLSNLIATRNAIQMLSDRINILLEFIQEASIKSEREPTDHQVIRAVQSIASSLPVMDENVMHTEGSQVC
jgi:hypothetical protein